MSQNFYSKNMELIEKFRPDIKKELERKTEDKNLKIDIISGKKGFPTLITNSPDGSTITVHSMYDPYKEAEKRIDSYEIEENDRVVILGVGLGYHIFEVFKRTSSTNTIIVIEPNKEIFYKAIEYFDWGELLLSPRVLFTFTLDEFVVTSFLNSGLQALLVPRFHVISLPYFRFYSDIEEKFHRVLQNVRDYIEFNLFTGFWSGHLFFKNLLKNFKIAINNPGVNEVKDVFKNKPIYVVAPGPSLNKNIEQLKRVKGKCLIFACDTSVKPMLTKEIPPDAVATVDPYEINYHKLKGVKLDNSFLFGGIEGYYEIPLNFSGDKFVYYHSPTTSKIYDPIIGEKGIVRSAGTVLADVINISIFMGGNPIVLVGVDLGFPVNKYYADGSFRDELEVDGNLFIEDIFGNKMRTNRSFYNFWVYFSSYFPELTNIKIIDATEGGAKIKGTEIKKLSETIDEYENFSYYPYDTLKEIHNKYVPASKDKIISDLDKVVEKYENLHNLVTKGIRLCNKIKDELNTKKRSDKLLNMFKRLKIKEKEINEFVEYIDFVDFMLQREKYQLFHFDFEKCDEVKEKKYEKVVDLSLDFYEGVKLTCNNVIEHFNKIKEELKE